MDVRIVGVGTANPPNRWSQEEIQRVYQEIMPLSEEARTLLTRFLENESIACRYLGFDQLTDALQTSQDELIARFKRFGVRVATDAARSALDDAGLTADDVDALVINTCTGYLCPGLTSYVAENLGLRKNVWPFDLMGMGCGGALPNLETASNFLETHPGSCVLSIAVEICSATIFFDESPDILVSNAIFGDGAAAVVLTNRPGTAGARVVGFASGLFPESRNALHYRWEDSRLRNVLSQRVPVLGARYAKQVVGDLLARYDLTVDDIDYWMVHPGGQKVLEAFQRTVSLPEKSLAVSRAVLRNYGNLSSAAVLFVLAETLRRYSPTGGQRGILCSFGAGFTAFAGLVEFGVS